MMRHELRCQIKQLRGWIFYSGDGTMETWCGRLVTIPQYGMCWYENLQGVMLYIHMEGGIGWKWGRRIYDTIGKQWRYLLPKTGELAPLETINDVTLWTNVTRISETRNPVCSPESTMPAVVPTSCTPLLLHPGAASRPSFVRDHSSEPPRRWWAPRIVSDHANVGRRGRYL